MNRANVIGPARVDLGADRGRRAPGRSRRRRGPGRDAPQVRAGVHGYATPAAGARAGARVRRACDRRGRSGSAPPRRTASAPGATDRRSARGAGGPRRSGPRRAAMRPRPRRDDGRGGRGCRRGPPRPAPRAACRATAGPSRSSSAPRTERGGRWPADRRPQAALLDERPRPRGDPPLEPGEPRADVRPATTSSARGSAATARTAARRSVDPVDDPGRRRGRTRRAPEQDEIERPVDVDAEPPAPRRSATS